MKLLRIMRWLALATLILLLLVFIGLSIYTRTENFTHWARDEAIAAVNGVIRGSLSADRLEGSVWRHLVLYNVALHYQDHEIVKIPRLEVSFSLLPLIWGELKIAAIDIGEPRANLVQDHEGQWNIVEALSPRRPEPEKASQFVVLVDRVRLRQGAIELRPAEDNGKPYHLTNLDLQGRVGVRPAGVSLQLTEMNTDLRTSGQPDLRLKGALEYNQPPTAPSTLMIRNLWAVSRNSQLKLNGELTNGEAVKLRAEAVLEKLAAQDIAHFVPQWPLNRDLTGNIAVDGAINALNGTVRLSSAGAKMVGNFRADLAQERPRYSASATLSGFNLRQWLKDQGIAGVVGGTIEASGNGFGLQETTGKTQLRVESAEAQGWKLGTIAIEGQLQRSTATVDGQLKSNIGVAHWSGKIIVAEKRPSYDLSLTAKDVDLQKVTQQGKPIEGQLNLKATLKGSGLSLADMDTRADVQVLPSTVASIAIKQGQLNVSLRENKMRIARAVLSTAESTLSASGELGLGEKVNGKLEYRLRIENIAPWLSLVGRSGSGAVDLDGQAQGNLSDLQARGTARAAGLRVDGTGVKQASIAYALRGSREQFFPQGSVTARVSDVEAGVALRRFDASAKLSRQPRSIEFDISAQDTHDHKHTVAGSANLLDDAVAVRLTRAAITAPDGVWKLLAPARVNKEDESVLIEKLALRNGEREVSLNGRFALSGKQDLTVNVDRFPVETFRSFVPQLPEVSGLLAMRARIAGTAAAPEITATARLSNGSIAGQPYAGADADVSYRDKRASLGLVIRQDASHALNGNATAPLNLSWQNGWQADFGSGLEAQAQSSGLSLAFLNAFGGKAVANIGGELSINVTARGSIKAPELRGVFALRDGKLKVIPLGVDINSVGIKGSLDSDTISVREFVVRANGGEIQGNGALPLWNYDKGNIKLFLSAKDWPAIQTARYQAKMAGNLAVQGAVTAPVVTGQLTVLEGSLRPDLAFLEQTKVPLKRDETVVVINHTAERENGSAQRQASPAPTDNQLFKKLGLDITVRAPGNLWIRHPELISELSGNLHATKKPDAEVDLTGRIDIVRGSLVFQGRKFQLSRGVVQFTGGDKINPALDILAEYKVSEYDVDVLLGGTAQKPSLTLTSEPRLEQADILALLLFGRPINALNQNEKGSVQQSALNITSGYVAGKIADSVSQALGLDTLGVDLREFDVSGGRVGFGRYVGGKTYVSVSQEFSGEHGREASIEYQVAPDWKVATSANSTGANGIDIIWHKRY